ncbi:hypothetical protein SRHO_G00141820 [Serrasalmus rhombeus]
MSKDLAFSEVRRVAQPPGSNVRPGVVAGPKQERQGCRGASGSSGVLSETPGAAVSPGVSFRTPGSAQASGHSSHSGHGKSSSSSMGLPSSAPPPHPCEPERRRNDERNRKEMTGLRNRCGPGTCWKGV